MTRSILTRERAVAVRNAVWKAETELWRTGFQALRAASDNVYVKLSMLNYTDADWDKDGSVVPGLVREIIDLFGSERCAAKSCSCQRSRGVSHTRANKPWPDQMPA